MSTPLETSQYVGDKECQTSEETRDVPNTSEKGGAVCKFDGVIAKITNTVGESPFSNNTHIDSQCGDDRVENKDPLPTANKCSKCGCDPTLYDNDDSDDLDDSDNSDVSSDPDDSDVCCFDDSYYSDVLGDCNTVANMTFTICVMTVCIALIFLPAFFVERFGAGKTELEKCEIIVHSIYAALIAAVCMLAPFLCMLS